MSKQEEEPVYYDNHKHYFGEDLVEFTDREDHQIGYVLIAEYALLTTQKRVMDAIKEDLDTIRSHIEESTNQ